MSETNKVIVRRYLEELWSKGNLSVADELFDSRHVTHDPSGPDAGSGPEAEKKRVSMYRSAFPDLTFTPHEMVAEGNIVVTRWTGEGTHKGELNGIPATGKSAPTTGMTFNRIEGGKIVETWTNWDALGLFQTLGVIPAFGKAKSAGQ